MSTQYNGVIDIRFAYQNNRTLATKTYHQGNSRISSNIMANGDLPYYFLISTGGGFVEGERYLQTVQLDTKAHAILTTQTPNYIYKCEHGHVTKQTNELTVKKDAFLEYYIDETIPYKDAQFAQSTTVNMEKGAKLILTDGLTRGWSPDDQPFQFGQVSQKVTIKYDHELVYNDFLIVNPQQHQMAELGFFEGFNNFNSVVIIDEAVNTALVDMMRQFLATLNSKCRYGISLTEHHGMVLRILGMSAYQNHQVMMEFINYYREMVHDLTRINLRKNNQGGGV